MALFVGITRTRLSIFAVRSRGLLSFLLSLIYDLRLKLFLNGHLLNLFRRNLKQLRIELSRHIMLILIIFTYFSYTIIIVIIIDFFLLLLLFEESLHMLSSKERFPFSGQMIFSEMILCWKWLRCHIPHWFLLLGIINFSAASLALRY